MLSTFISVKTRMPDLCADVWNYAFTLRAATEKPEAVKGKIANLFRLLDKQARMAGAEQADVQQAKFALCAYLDEIAMAGPLAGGWASLCQEYFGEPKAAARSCSPVSATSSLNLPADTAARQAHPEVPPPHSHSIVSYPSKC